MPRLLLLLLALAAALALALPLVADATALHEIEKLLASDARFNDDFGWSVAASGDIAVVGAWLGGSAFIDTGAAYVFQRDLGGEKSWGEVQKLIASDAEDRDHFGWRVGVSGDNLIAGADGEDAAGTDAGAAYVFRRDQGGGSNWGEVQKLIASDAQELDHFGWSVALSGDTAIVGAHPQNADGFNHGAAYIFRRNAGGIDNWGEVKKLEASDAIGGEAFGVSVAISNDIIVVGACCADSPDTEPGAAYVFQRDVGGTDNWGEVKRLLASDGEDGDRFGTSVAVDAGSAVVGALTQGAAGAAYVFEQDDGGVDNWGEVKKLTASDADEDDRFGISVAVSADTAVVGAHVEDSRAGAAGAAYLFSRDAGGADRWGEVAKLTASDAEEDDRFGISVAVSGDTAVVGAYREDEGAGGAGAAYLFDLMGEKFAPKSTPTDLAPPTTTDVPTPSPTIVQGKSGDVNCDGSTNVVDAALVLQFSAELLELLPCAAAADVNDDDLIDSLDGALILQFTAGLLTSLPVAALPPHSSEASSIQADLKITASDEEPGDQFGVSVSASGDTVVVGAPFEDAGGGPAAGAAYVYRRDASTDTWFEVQKLVASDRESGDGFGQSVGVSDDDIIVGAWLEDGGGVNAGAAYIFKRDADEPDLWGQVAKLTAREPAAYDRFGVSVAITGDIAVVGASAEDTGGNRAGAAFIYQRDAGGADVWGQVKQLTASDAEPFDRFGWSVAASGDTAVVGAFLEDTQGSGSGAAYVFQRDQGGTDNWGEVKKLTASNGEPDDEFGISVAVDKNEVVVGAWRNGAEGFFAGAAYVYGREAGGANSWGEVAKLNASDARDFDRMGVSVGVIDGTVVVGAPGEAPTRDRAGAAYVFWRDAGGTSSWGEVAKVVASDAGANDRFGTSVTVSATAAVAGAPFADSEEDQAGAVYLFDLTSLRSAQTGDVNCDGVVNAIDVALVLQFVVAVVRSLPCTDRADANFDDVIDSIDAALILQFTAGLVGQLPASS